EFSRRLRAWFRANARDLPWRRTRDAYHVLVSELMLQQTQVSRVESYYGEFLARFPTLANVARVLRRAFAPSVDTKSPQGQRVAWQLAESLLPRTGRATWTHNQALMELGALICTARVAHCDRCPVRRQCLSASKPAAGRTVRSQDRLEPRA